MLGRVGDPRWECAPQRQQGERGGKSRPRRLWAGRGVGEQPERLGPRPLSYEGAPGQPPGSEGAGSGSSPGPAAVRNLGK